ncbi:hypothetical protein RQM47_02115 [Rubrivirga sp. S365]|uniref:1,4-alpha-glucan branching enzyme n=1 Tax=Rubrivirga litoralis TaxID=3075598 RepID=A0ABU3BTI9_9BACT|nr:MULTISPECIES: hypothetical protein [unclassified Rubrivirga]MDT0632609.1 hypothetical protein [Rubrivirga sp. F394]MDT7855431.1 hypothetical protein [Rubrivirga sp. S365]
MSQTTTDHNTIRTWADERGGTPAAVKDTQDGDSEVIRLMFPDAPQSESDNLKEISWDEWFEQFDANGLALLYQDQTDDGETSRFNKLVSR